MVAAPPLCVPWMDVAWEPDLSSAPTKKNLCEEQHLLRSGSEQWLLSIGTF